MIDKVFCLGIFISKQIQFGPMEQINFESTKIKIFKFWLFLKQRAFLLSILITFIQNLYFLYV